MKVSENEKTRKFIIVFFSGFFFKLLRKLPQNMKKWFSSVHKLGLKCSQPNATLENPREISGKNVIHNDEKIMH